MSTKYNTTAQRTAQESMRIGQGLTLNFLEVVLNKNELSLLKTVYSDNLYTKYKSNPDFFIYRFDGDLYVWQLRPTSESLPGTFEEAEITIEEHAPIFTKIVESVIVEFFRSNDYQVFRQKHSSIWEVELKHEEQKQFGALSLQPTLVFSLRNLYSKLEKRQVIALTVRRCMKPIFTGSEEVITSQLTDTRGLTRNNKGEIVASAHNRHRYLESTGLQQAYEKYLDRIESSSNEFEYLKKCAENFNKVASKLYIPNGLEISNFILVNLSSASFNSTCIQKPKYFYYNERSKPGYYNKIVSELGPYSLDLFSNERLNILVVSPDEYEGSIEEYIVTLDNKLRDLFHLKNVKFHLKTVKSQETYLDVLDKIDANDYNLAIILFSQQDKEIDTPQSPYYLTKAKLLNQRLPTQNLTIEVLRKNDDIINNNVALNVYSKLGGTAWTIEKSQKDISELIIGIGSTTDDSGEWIIGFANVFDYNGTYLVGDCSQLSTMAEYAKNLEIYLINTLEHAFHEKNLSEGDRVRLIFHLFKEAGREYELEAVDNALKHFEAYDIQYSLVHLSYNHNFRIFANQGRHAPARGTFIQLSYRQALLHLGGRSVVPIQVRLDKRSEYKDIYEITRQVLYFTHLSYRSFIPTSKPVTIKYPNLMTKMVYELKQVPGWDYSILDKLNDKLWFI